MPRKKSTDQRPAPDGSGSPGLHRGETNSCYLPEQKVPNIPYPEHLGLPGPLIVTPQASKAQALLG